MRIEVFAAHWGNNELPPDVFIDKVLAAGFDGIEMSLPLDAALRKEWTDRIARAGLQLIAAQWETVFHSDFEQHRAALAELLENACLARPVLVNTHTGKDYYSQAQHQCDRSAVKGSSGYCCRYGSSSIGWPEKRLRWISCTMGTPCFAEIAAARSSSCAFCAWL